MLTGAHIQFKQVEICASSSTARSFAGYIHLPSNSLRKVGLDQSKPINIFFWFIESQDAPEKAPLTLYRKLFIAVASFSISEQSSLYNSERWSWCKYTLLPRLFLSLLVYVRVYLNLESSFRLQAVCIPSCFFIVGSVYVSLYHG